MVRRSQILALALLTGGLLSVGASVGLNAATSSTLDILSDHRVGDAADSVDVSGVKPLARPNREPVKAPPGGNPLWSVPLSVLSATQQRPIFSASRRPPQRAVVAPEEQVIVPPPPKPAEPERPALALIGAVVGDGDAIAIFLDRTNQKIVRLRQGDTHSGWVLSLVQGREVTLNKAHRREVLVLLRQEVATGALALPRQAFPGEALPAKIAPGAGGLDSSYAPFTPRSTPKNGESDGL